LPDPRLPYRKPDPTRWFVIVVVAIVMILTLVLMNRYF
jgi:hypothetical protein